jgi:Contractile injection system tube protein/LysM domain
MSLQKLTITYEDANGKFDNPANRIEAQFNPEKYSLTKGVHFAEIDIPGLGSPILQFVRGLDEKITLELFYDTTDSGMVNKPRDVRQKTVKIYDLLKINSATHAPPRCKLSWGDGGQLFSFGSSLNPRCVVESVSEEFNLFSPSGIPLRAKLNVTFREYKTIEDQLEEKPKHSPDRTKFRTVQRGETLSYIAWTVYGDSTQWRPIADANTLANPRLLIPGTQLRIPSLTSSGAST